MILQYWTTKFPGWGLSLIFWVVLVLANIVTVRVYGEVRERVFWSMITRLMTLVARVLAQLVESHNNNRECIDTEHIESTDITVYIQIFIILGIAVNCGANTMGEYIGGRNWFIGDAPFVGGIGGFASVFVTAAFACECSSALCYLFDRWRGGYPISRLPTKPKAPPGHESHQADIHQTEEPSPLPSPQARLKILLAICPRLFGMFFGGSSYSIFSPS